MFWCEHLTCIVSAVGSNHILIHPELIRKRMVLTLNCRTDRASHAESAVESAAWIEHLAAALVHSERSIRRASTTKKWQTCTRCAQHTQCVWKQDFRFAVSPGDSRCMLFIIYDHLMLSIFKFYQTAVPSDDSLSSATMESSLPTVAHQEGTM